MRDSLYYVYVFYDALRTPIYVGKGRANRMNEHFSSAFKDYRQKYSFWLTHLRRMMEANETPVVEKVAENLTEDEAFKLEIALISKYGRIGIEEGGTLYNRAKGGTGRAATKFENIRARLIEQNKSRGIKVAQLDKTGKQIAIWESAGAAERHTKISRGGILDAAKRKDKLFKNFFWRFEDDLEFNGIQDPSVYLKADTRRRNNHSSKKLNQLDKNGAVIEVWDSMSEAIRNFPKSHARAFDEAIRDQKEYKGFFWSR